MPILISLAMEEYSDNIILYYQSKEIEVEANNISKIIEMPDKYFITIAKGTEERNEFVGKLLKEFKIEGKEKQRINIKLIIDEMKKWVLSLPRIVRDMNNTNSIIKEESYIIFKNELLKSDLNNNEFLFVKTKEIFNEDSYNEIAKKIITLKKQFDNYLVQYIDDLIVQTKELFEHNSKSNLNSLLKNWSGKINEKIKFKIMSIEIKNLFEFINNITTYNDSEIIQNISHIILGLYVEDWEDNTSNIFYDKVANIIKEVNELKVQKEDADEAIEIQNGDKVIKKYIGNEEITQIGKTLQNNIEDTMEEYGSSVSESQKIKILLEIMKKYI